MGGRFIISILLVWAVWGAERGRAAITPSGPLIQHAPTQPKAGQSVSITARVNVPKATGAVLRVQVVEPGTYLRRTDAAFTNSWRELPMQKSADGLFAATLPPDMQQHRRLVRYVVQVTDARGVGTRFPAATNDCPNFAYFVYDGLPSWTGANQPGRTPLLTFPAEFMKTMPAYHLIAQRDDVQHSQWDGNANKQRFFGTLVYDGVVYDHIQFLNRGKASTYVAGKNKWGFKFNESQPFATRDLWGQPSTNAWKSVSLTACASPWAPVNRGMAGMDEAVSFRAYQLAGVPSASTHWIQFRVISARSEAGTSQYTGDLWGLYQVVEEPGGPWLREHGLPDGDIYYPESGLKHRAQDSPTNDVAWQQFMRGVQRNQPASWWRTNLDLPRYYTFHALNRALGNVDLRPGANHYLYHQPDGRWCIVPWDLDMMFIARTHQPGYVEASRCLEVRELKVEYQNRAREVLDLFCSDPRPNGGQIGQLVDELAAFLSPADFKRTWPELDMCLWNHHPRSHAKGQFYVTPYQDSRFGGQWTRTLATPDFDGFRKYIVDYCTDSRPQKDYAINDGDQRGYGFGYLLVESNSRSAPERPAIRLTGEERKEMGFRFKVFRVGPSKTVSQTSLRFEISEFKSPAGVTNTAFAALQWRVAEISAPGLAGYRAGEPRKYEIEELWRSEEVTAPTNRFVLPLTMCEPGHTYRIRARYKNNLERWSHWSEPVQLVAR